MTSYSPPSIDLDIRPLSAHIGAEIHGVDISQPLDPDVVAQVREALLTWKVVFFRDQELDHEQHQAFARQFGELTPAHPLFDAEPDNKAIYPIDKGRQNKRHAGGGLASPWQGWHTDVTAAHNPPWASILRAHVIPPYGGDTQWTNLVAAYDGLSPAVQQLADGLRAIHQFTPPKGARATEDFTRRTRETPLLTEHPIVRVHPETGEKALYVSPGFLQRIVDVSPRESELLLQLFWEQIIRTKYTVRFKWEPGSVAFWDNRATAHLAPTDIDDLDFDRLLYRVTLVGDVPVGPDGQESVALEGHDFAGVTA